MKTKPKNIRKQRQTKLVRELRKELQEAHEREVVLNRRFQAEHTSICRLGNVLLGHEMAAVTHDWVEREGISTIKALRAENAKLRADGGLAELVPQVGDSVKIWRTPAGVTIAKGHEDVYTSPDFGEAIAKLSLPREER